MPRLLCFLLLCFLRTAATAQAQEVRLAGQFQNAPLPEVLSVLEKSYGLSFSYDVALAERVRVTVRFRNLPASQAVRTILKGTGLSYDRLDGGIFLIKPIAENPPQQTPPSTVLLCGTVLQRDNGEPLPGATVQLISARAGTVAGLDGAFRLEAPGREADSIRVSCIGFEPVCVPLTDNSGKRPCRSFFLEVSENWMKAVEVKAFATDLVRFDTSGRGYTFRPEGLAHVPAWGQPDVMRGMSWEIALFALACVVCGAWIVGRWR